MITFPFFGVVIAAVGLGLLSLLAMLIKALTGRRRVHQPRPVGAWSGVVTALTVTATVLAALFAIGLFGFVKTRSVTNHVVLHRSSQVSAMPSSSEAKHVRSSAEQPATELIPIDVPSTSHETSTPEVPAEAGVAPPPAAADDTLTVENTVTSITTPLKHSEADKAAFVAARKAQLQNLAARFGQMVRSHLESADEAKGASSLGHAAKSDNGDVVVFQPSDDMVQLLLGAGGQDLLKSFNSELPGRIRQTYALIPLTPPVGAALPVKPLLAAGGLESIANSIVSIVKQAEDVIPGQTPATEVATLPAESDGTLTVAPLIRPTPDWVGQTDGRRIVAHSRPILQGDDVEAPLAAAINEALTQHIASVTENMNPDLHHQARFVRMELPLAAAKKCVVDTFDRWETMSTETEGEKSFLIRYALLEFPESVDQLAVRQIRQSIQMDRIVSVGVVVGCVWLSIFSAGFGIRQWRKGTKLRRLAATPVFVVITIPTLLAAAGMVVALSQGNVPHVPWNSQPVTVELQDV